MDLAQKHDESNIAYHKRLVYGKLVDKTLSDIDYTELAEALYGQPYSPDVARRMIYGSKRTLDALAEDAEHDIEGADILGELDAKKLELQKERQRFFDQRAAFNKLVRERSRQEELNDILRSAVTGGSLPVLQYEPAGDTRIYGDNDLLVSLNDIHYGAKVDNYWNTYNSDVCREMMARYLDKVISIGHMHKSENCIVWANGDLISGSIHHSISVTNKENVIEQIMGVSELIAQFLAELSKHFANVYYTSVSGNHSRMDTKERALKDERLDDLVEWYLEARLQSFPNITVNAGNRVDETMYLLNVRGKVYCGVHGDFDETPGKIQTLQTMAGVPVYAVLSGHLHHNKIDSVQGVRTVMAGSFLGMDDYCVQRRIFGNAEQLVCVCDESGIVCTYDIPLQ